MTASVPKVKPLLLIEANEVNFEFVGRYARRGDLPLFASLLARANVVTTNSEAVYEHLEPWIQWVTVHTGLPFSDHGVFRLGDAVGRNLDQIWEVLERKGLSVGAVSPMNAENRLRSPAFFVPDPWTPTTVSGDKRLERLHRAIAQFVGTNAEGRITVGAVTALLNGFLAHVSPARWFSYASLLTRSFRRPWLKAVFLDELLVDVFLSLSHKTRPHFASLFLNAAAHIQHHYMFNSAVYTGSQRNPDWYVRPGEDPLLDVYLAYDRALARMMAAFPDARFLIATGLHQDPHVQETYYWRLKNHAGFLSIAQLDFSEVTALMSRDFVVRCSSTDQAARVQSTLETARIIGDDSRVFECDNRGHSIFCTLVYAKDIKAGTTLQISDRNVDFSREVAFVAIKNGQHNGTGYLVDTDMRTQATTIPLAAIYSLISEHFGASLTNS